MQVEAENTRNQDAVTHFELPELHVADELLDDDSTAELSLNLPRRLRHALHTSTQDIDAGGPLRVPSMKRFDGPCPTSYHPGLRYE